MASRIELSAPQTVRCPPLDSLCDPAGRGLVDGLLKPWEVQLEGTHILTFCEASLFGGRLIATPDDRLYSDYELTPAVMDLLVRGAGDIKTAEHQLTRNGDSYASAALSQAPVRLDGVHTLLTSSEPINYGAWLIRVFPKLHNLKRAGAFDTGRMLCFVDRPWQRSLLSWMGVNLDRLVHQSLDQHYSVETLIVPTWPSRGKFLDAGIRAFVAETRRRVLRAAGPAPGKMIYVSRLGWSRETDRLRAAIPGAPRIRAFDQEATLIERLAMLGIESFSPEEHSFEETLEVFAKARFVIGPQGSGLFNAIFCRPGTPVVEIAHLPYFARGHANLFLSSGLRYMVVVGADQELGEPGVHEIHRALTIDIDRTVAFFARQIEALAPFGDADDRMQDWRAWAPQAQTPRRAASIIAGLRDDARAATAAGDFAGAAEAWGRLRPLAPDNLEAFLSGAAALASCGRHEAAQAVLDSAVESFPNNEAVLIARARHFASQSQWMQAERAWSALHALRPSQSGPLIEWVQSLTRQGKQDAAERLATYAAARFPKDVAILNLHARMAVAATDWGQAEKRWARLRGVEPAKANTWLQQAIALRALGQAPEAEALLAEAATLFPDDAPIATLQRRWQHRLRTA